MVPTSFLLFASVELHDQVLVLGLGYFLCCSKSVLIVLLSSKASAYAFLICANLYIAYLKL